AGQRIRFHNLRSISLAAGSLGSERQGHVTFRSPISSHRRKRSDDMRWALQSAILVGLALDAQGSDKLATVGVYKTSTGRIAAIVGAVVGVIGVVIGRRALSRSAGGVSGAGNGRRGAGLALVLGAIGLLLGGLVVITAGGGLGTGHGFGGGILAMMVGLGGMTPGGLGPGRSTRSEGPRPTAPPS